jgi:cytochrome P450
LSPQRLQQFRHRWEYPDDHTALRGLLSSGPAMRAIQHAGEEAVRDVVVKALAPFKNAAGGYLLRNKYRCMIAQA